MIRLRRFLSRLFLAALLLGGASAAGIYYYLIPQLPSAETLKDIRLQVPLKVYTRDSKLLAEFGEKRRSPLQLVEVPDNLAKAFLAAEDANFYRHPGVDWEGIARALLHIVRTGRKGPGGSTITMQVARNFFLSTEKTYLRKLNEILLALKIEQELSKGQILELYLNKIFLGNRAYGIGAAAQVYYGKPVAQLNLAQMAMIAGLPKAPSRFNPLANPIRAVERRSYVLGRMRALDIITASAFEQANSAIVSARYHGPTVETEAAYLAEMVRAQMEVQLGAEAYTGGYQVYTTVESGLQQSARLALRAGLRAYDRRHGYRGPEAKNQPTESSTLTSITTVGTLYPAVVRQLGEQEALVVVKDHGEVTLGWKGMAWARPYVDENRRGPIPKTAAEILQLGDRIRVRLGNLGWELAQLPKIEGALVAINPQDGAIAAIAGGYNFHRSKFNRATQAKRQPGSNFKPFIYSAALEKGYTAASLINDAPVVFDDPGLEAAWRPENYSGKFFGPTRLRWALTKSRNLVSIRLLRAIGIPFALRHAKRFGFDTTSLPRDLSLALGSGAITPLELATGYGVLANGGYRIKPWFIERIVGQNQQLIYRANPIRVCAICADEYAASQEPGPSGAPKIDQYEVPFTVAERAISPANAWLMQSMLADVIQRGTGRRARVLRRKDLAGKTGTTNDQHDAWFSGFNHRLAATAWVGFDQLQPLGRRETGGRAALPIWIDFMREALRDVPEEVLEQPEDLVTVRIDPDTGLRVSGGHAGAVFETFRPQYLPRKLLGHSTPATGNRKTAPPRVTERLF